MMMNTKTYVTPVDSDVMCGRGRAAFRHAGNHALREKIALNAQTYMKCRSRKAKTALIHEIILSVTKEGGKFLQYDKSAEKWFDGGLDAGKNRVGAAFRDASAPGKVKYVKELRASFQRKRSFNEGSSVGTSSSQLLGDSVGPLSPSDDYTKPIPLRRQVAWCCPSSLLSLWASKIDVEPQPVESGSEGDLESSSATDILEVPKCDSHGDYYPTVIFVPRL